MSVRSFRPVFMAGGVAAAALSCYLVSLRVASERAALEAVETEILVAERDIRLLQTEIGTRGRLAQLERWNVRVLQLSAPSVDQFVPDSFRLASLVTPQAKPVIEAPVVYASAPAAPEPSVLPSTSGGQSSVARGELLHEASLTAAPPSRRAMAPLAEAAAKPKPKVDAGAKPAAKAPATAKRESVEKAKPSAGTGKAKDSPRAAAGKRTETKLAHADPLAPLASAKKPARPRKSTGASTSKDSGKTR